MKTRITWNRVNSYLRSSGRKTAPPKLIENHLDEDFYLARNHDIRAAGMDAAHHFYHFGANEGRDPTEYFSTRTYQEHFGKFIPKGMNPFLHFLKLQLDLKAGDTKDRIAGGPLKYSVHDLVAMNAEFDLGFYISHNGFAHDRFDNPLEGLIHYLKVGWRNGYDPSRDFNTKYYFSANPDIKHALVNPLHHYLNSGRSEHRRALPPRYKHGVNTCLVDLARQGNVTPRETVLELREDVTLVVPVFNAAADTADLFACLTDTIDPSQHIVVVNDASTDAKIRPLIDKFEQKRPGTTTIHRTQNLGFSGAVNDGMRLAEGRHLVLLNTDLMVPMGWLARLMAPIDAAPDGVATVTPFSNTSSLTGFPAVAQESKLFLGLGLGQVDDAFRRLTPVTVDLPSGCGFCMALSAAAIEQIGTFDTETYKRGYFEETDWCQRAVVSGFRHVMASNLFVEHKPGSSSFSVASRIELSEANKVKFNARHPAYWERVRLFRYSDPAQRLRTMAKLQLQSAAAKKTVLLISHSWGGGLSDYIKRAEKRLLKQGAFVINLQCENSEATVAFRSKKSEHVEKTDMTTALEAILKLGVDEAEIHALHGSDNILDQVSALATALQDVAYRIVLHDFVMICPTIHLVDSTGRYCGVPGVDKCLDCLHQNSEARYPILNMSQWRAPWRTLAQGADQIVMLDESARDIVMRAYPEIDPSKLVVSPPKYQPNLRPVQVPRQTAALNIAVLGVLSKHKGAEVVRNLLRHLEESADLHSTTLFGEWMSQHAVPQSLKLNGRFEAKDLPKLMEKSGTQVVLFPSVCPETFSFTLTEIFEMELPVVGYDIGAQGRRIARYKKGITVPMDDTSGESLLDALKRAAEL